MHCRADVRYYPGSYALLSDDPATIALVFVHGFAGNAVTTWLDFHSQVDGPTFASLYARSDLFFYSYDSTGRTVEQSAEALGNFVEDVVAAVSERTFRLWLPPGRDWSKVAKPGFLDTLERKYERIVFVAHSLGGVVVRRLILNSAEGSRHWAQSHDRVLASPPILFAPAIKGFRHEITVSHAVSSLQLLTIAFAIWSLTRGEVYVDVVQSSNTLKELQRFTEAGFHPVNGPMGLKADIYWGIDEKIVIPGRYAQDTELKEPNRDHTDICKPSKHFEKPVGWVARAIE